MLIDLAAVILVFIATLALGARQPWAMAGFSAGALLILIGKLIKDIWENKLKLRFSPVLLPLAGLFALVGIQLLIPWVSLDASKSGPYTVEPHSTGIYLLLAAGYFALWYSVSHGSRASRKLEWILILIVGFGILEALLGLGQFLSGLDKDKIAHGTLENRNHYALLMNFAIAAGIGYLYMRTLELLHGRKLDLRTIVVMADSPKLILIVVWLALMGFAVFATQSRMGILALVLSLGIMISSVATIEKKRYTSILVLCVLLGTVALALYSGIDAIFERYADLSAPGYLEANRLSTWRDAWPMIKETPWFGKGLGSFQWTFLAHESLQPDIPAAYAHNDYLQAVAEIGIVGLALILLIFVFCLWTARKNLRSPDPLVKGWGLATLGALSAAALQEVTDYSLCTPGVAALLVLLLAANERAHWLSLRRLKTPETQV